MSKCQHSRKELHVLIWAEWALDQAKKGIVPAKCPECGLYFFPCEYKTQRDYEFAKWHAEKQKVIEAMQNENYFDNDLPF